MEKCPLYLCRICKACLAWPCWKLGWDGIKKIWKVLEEPNQIWNQPSCSKAVFSRWLSCLCCSGRVSRAWNAGSWDPDIISCSFCKRWGKGICWVEVVFWLLLEVFLFLVFQSPKSSEALFTPNQPLNYSSF